MRNILAIPARARGLLSTGTGGENGSFSYTRVSSFPRLLLGRGSTSCRACTHPCDDDRAGDIVRTCRDYVIGLSGNVPTLLHFIPASDFSRISIETPAAIIGSAYPAPPSPSRTLPLGPPPTRPREPLSRCLL